MKPSTTESEAKECKVLPGMKHTFLLCMCSTTLVLVRECAEDEFTNDGRCDGLQCIHGTQDHSASWKRIQSITG